MSQEEQQAALERVALHQREYRLTFGCPWGQNVLADLMTECRFRVALNGQGPIDTSAMLVAEGKRQMFLFIVQRLNLTAEQLYQLYAETPLKLGEDENG